MVANPLHKDSAAILARLPYGQDFCFVEGIHQIDEQGVEASFFFRPDLPFYRDHFIEQAITPGVILTECMAQVGLVCQGIYLLNLHQDKSAVVQIAFTQAQVEFLQPVYPGELVQVRSSKKMWRLGSLRAEVELYNAAGNCAARAKLGGIIKRQS